MSAGSNDERYVTADEAADPWDEVLHGAREPFRDMTSPFIPALLEEARKGIKREKMLGNLSDKLLPEEVVGEALIQAWIRRYSRPPHESLKEWLMANMRWALRLLVLQEKDWLDRKAVSLEQPAMPRLAGDDHDEWDWITPQFMTRPVWRDILADDHSIHAA